MPQANVRIFVYGTLKEGYGNHRLLQAAVVSGYAAFVPGYTLYGQGIPYAVPTAESTIEGEVYLLADPDGSVMARLDRLEGHPVHYRRTQVVAFDARDPQRRAGLPAWMYVRAGGAADLPQTTPHLGSKWPKELPAAGHLVSDQVSGI